MIKHIVLFKLKDKKDLPKAKEALLGLQGKIEVLRFLEVGENFTDSPRAFDLALVTAFDSKEDVQVYQNHPCHLPVVKLMGEICEKSPLVDYVSSL